MIKKIYIIDDSEFKRENIREYLTELYPNAEFVELTFVNEGLLRICRTDKANIINNPSEHLVVIDMVMPRFYCGMPEADAGYSVLAEMNRCKLSCPALIASSESVDDNRASDYYENYLGSVKEKGSVFCLPFYEELLKDYLD